MYGNSVKFKLLEKFEGIENLYNCSLDDLVYFNLNDKLISKILDINLRLEAKKDLEYINKNNIEIIWYDSEFYPEKLKFIKDKPVSFYLRGNKEILNNKSVGIVGSRKSYKSSLEYAKKIAREFSKREINVVSGLARGIDKFAHLGCLEEKGKTIAVLGNGIDNESIYPYENKRVYERILENGGAIISEYPLKTKPLPYNFPYRNRIISGLSDIIVIVQASTKSGSLITVDYALDQGKDVYVYRNENIDKEEFSGNKLLLEQGAKVIL